MGLLNIIHRMLKRQKLSICEIAWLTGVSRNTVTKHLAANVHAYLSALINRENRQRAPNDLADLPVPSHQTVLRHRKELLSPTEYMVATSGDRYARNKRGRGSSDVRALMIGELCEIDECRASWIISAKVKGSCQTLF